MKKTLLQLLVITLLAMTANLTMAQTYTFPVKGSQGFAMTNKTRDGAHISYQLGQFSLSQLNYRDEEMSEISIKAVCIPNDAGLPNLPAESRMMAIPQGAKATLSVVRAEQQTFHNVNIAPALRIQAESEEPDMEYKKDMKVYSKNAFYPENPFTVSKSYIRGVDAVTVSVTPFQYNPVTKDLVVYTDIELAINYEGGNGHFGEDRLRSPYWDPILAAELMNYDQLPVIDYEARMQDWIRDGADGAEYLIITPNNDAWAPYAQQLKEYRMQQGIITEVYRLDEMPATTTAAMKTWFHNAYNTWDIAPVAVCMLGDHGTNMGQYVPAETAPHPYGSCITDNGYADVVGNDNLPDMVFSRLIAETPEQLPIFVGKQIEYEYTNPNTDPSFYANPITALGWQTERWFQICSEVFGGYMRNHGYNPQRINCVYSGTPGTSWSSNQNTSMVVNYFGPNGRGYIPATPSELGGWTGGTPDQVVQAVNNGAFWLQHRDHGEEVGWGEPAVKNSHVAQMNNVGKLPFVMSINCLTGKFNYSNTCFCEAWMRQTYNGQNAGAVGVLCPTETSYSFVNDAFVWGVYDLFDGDFMPDFGPYQPAGPKTGNWMPAFGNVAGKYFLAQSSWPYNTDDKDITYTMFTAHCDAFLRIYTQVPQAITPNHLNVQLAGLTTFQITAPEGTTIALTTGEGENMEILAVATATGSVQNIEIPSQVPPTVIRLTITGQNYLRYEADIDVIPADGPYVIINQYTLSDEAPQLNFGDETGFNIQLKNVGNTQAPAGTITLTSESEYVTITDGTADFTAINSNDVLDLSEAFSFTISDEVPNKTNIEFLATITSGNDTYEYHITMKAYAPVFEIGNVTITELEGNGNGRLDPGERARLRFPIMNKGNADSRVADATLTMNNVFLQITSEPSVTVNGIDANGSAAVEFDVYVGGAPSGFAAEYTLDVVSGVYTDSRDFMSKIGLNVEDFELGTIDPTMWSNDTSHPWTMCTDQPYEGNYCMKSGAISDSQETLLTLTYEVGETDSIAFYYKVSSENNYDKLYFYIDNTEMGYWSGSINWTKAQYHVMAGNHTFKWKYKKDSSVSNGSDCCWIDFVILPRDLSMAGSAGLDMAICKDESAQILGYAANYQTLLWTTSGDGTFDDATLMNPVYTPGVQDNANGTVTLTITISGSHGNTITDDMTLNINENVVLDYAINDAQYCGLQEPQPVAVQVVSGDYASFVWTTSGSGEFADPNELSTTYTPSAEDIAAGSVTLLATANSAGCGPVTLEYPFEMNQAPMMDMPLPNCILMACQGQDYIVDFATLSGYIDGQMTMEINGEAITLIEGQPLTLPTASLVPGNYTFEFHHLSNGLCEIDPNSSLDIEVLEAPSLTVDNTNLEICKGETATFEFTVAGGDINDQNYTIEGDGIEPISFNGTGYTYSITPSETTEIRLTKITSANSGCGSDCETVLDLTLTINVIPTDIAPAISGDSELDARVTPISEFTVTNGLMSSYSIAPEEAGTLLPANDGLSVTVTWSQTYKGQAVLTASPVSECNNLEGNLAITVKNSTGVGEWEANAKLYPNPTSDKVYVEAEGMNRVTVYNNLGQMVYDSQANTDRLSIDMAQFQAGSYLVKISTGNGICIRHLNVIK
ncbi:MAG: T9SS type A sorting domain-containing protein [Bacteroidales bacterium]|nr:T9SS type A sorting domain-containing protein [Bacteroidales bacterium]